MKNSKLTYGQMCKQIRKSLNITQETMSKKLGISRGYVSEIETEAKFPSIGIRMELKTLHLRHCAFKKPQPLVEVMTPKETNKSLFQRIVEFFKGLF